MTEPGAHISWRHDYRRTRLPPATRSPVLLQMALWAGVIFSPFVAFAVNGRVDGSNWAPAIITASCCLACLTLSSVRAARAYRLLPPDVRAEYSHGRLMPPLPGGGSETGTLEFALRRNGPPLVGLTPQGVWFAPAAMSGGSWRKMRDMAEINVKAHLVGAADLPAHAIQWDGIAEWEVREDSDGPDFYRLTLRDGAFVNLKRPDDPALEVRILDHVRAVGGRPVRLFCDIA